MASRQIIEPRAHRRLTLVAKSGPWTGHSEIVIFRHRIENWKALFYSPSLSNLIILFGFGDFRWVLWLFVFFFSLSLSLSLLPLLLFCFCSIMFWVSRTLLFPIGPRISHFTLFCAHSKRKGKGDSASGYSCQQYSYYLGHYSDSGLSLKYPAQ
jgi:hypothetical protein